jgi:exodeoxyribonuclease VII small subunit
MTTKKSNYKSLNAELDEVLSKLQAEDTDVDEALALYERGIKITRELETYLKESENKVKKIKKDFSS